MKHFIREVAVTFRNVYEMGTGFVTRGGAAAWRSYWENINRRHCDDVIFWTYCPPAPRSSSCGYLVSGYGKIYLHPLDFRLVTVCYNENGDKNALAELERLCREAAAATGGSSTLAASKQIQVTFPEKED